MDPDRIAFWLNVENRELVPDPQELEEMVEAVRMPSLLMVKMPTDRTPGTPGCWLGGEPTLPPDIAWPWVRSPDIPEYPMNFFAQIDLAQVPRIAGMPDLPVSGTLFFFADYVDYVERRTHPNYAVIHVDGDVSDLPPRSQPDFPEDFSPSFCMYWWEREPRTSFRLWPVSFRAFDTWDYQRYKNAALWKAAIERSVDAVRVIQRRAHRDQAAELQGAVPPEGQRRTEEVRMHSLFGPHLLHLPARLQDGGRPVRLLTVERDRDLGFGGEQLGFFIGADDLAARRFDRAYAFTETD